MASQLETALDGYQAALTVLERAGTPSPELILKVLVSRDTVRTVQKTRAENSADLLMNILELDGRLREQAVRIIEVANLPDWRISFDPPAKAWWWFLEVRVTAGQLNEYIQHYETALASLNSAVEKLPVTANELVERTLNVFAARDTVQSEFNKTEPYAESLMRIGKSDSHLRQQLELISQKVSRKDRRNLLEQLEDLRDIVNPSENSWWWFQKIPIYPWDRLDLAWNTLTIVWLGATFSLLVDISTRFLSGGPGTIGAFAVVFQAILALAGGGALTKAGQSMVDHTLKSLKIPRYLWQEVKLVAAGLLLLLFVGFRFLLPQIAVVYNNDGYLDYEAGRLDSAEAKYKRAIALNPDYTEAHYNLGLLYEDLQKSKQAETEYGLAVQNGFPLAHNNLARLYILAGKYPFAVNLLSKGIDQLEKDKYPIQNKEAVRYSLFKNLGWVRFKQGYYEEAKVALEAAILQEKNEKQAAAYCLLAQTLEKLKLGKKAQEMWELCNQYPTNADAPEEDEWAHLAAKKLKGAGLRK